MNALDNCENWVVIGPSYVELGPQVPAMGRLRYNASILYSYWEYIIYGLSHTY